MDLDRARKILNVAHSAFISLDETGRITYWNIRAEETFGLSREQAVGRDVVELIVPKRFRPALREGFARFRAGGETPLLDTRTEQTAIRSDGSEFPVELIVSAVPEPTGVSLHAFISDISERRAREAERLALHAELERALAGSEQRLQTIVDSLAEAITIRGLDNRVTYANRAALERLGLDSAAELAEIDPRELLGSYVALAEDGSRIDMRDLPSVRVLRGEDAEPLMMRTIDQVSGEERWMLLKAAAVRDGEGVLEAAVTIIEDVTVTKRLQLQSEFLARAATLLASSLDYQQTLRNVAALIVPGIADWCAVDLLDGDGRREPVAVAHVDESGLEIASQLRAHEPELPDPDRGLGRVLRTGRHVLYNGITDEMLAAAAVDERHLELLRAVGMRAVLIVPMALRGRIVGTITMVSAASSRAFDETDVEFAGQIAGRAAMAVENARLYGERSEVARTLQSSLLPEALPEMPGWEVAALYRPAGTASDVGGDFYDFWAVGDAWLMMIGDVTGKGVQAASVTSLVRHTARTASEFDSRPGQILARINSALKRSPELSVCTALCLRVHGGVATLAAGGHPLLWRLGEGGAEEVGMHGTLLGAFERAEWPEHTFELRLGDTLVGITDGVTDTVGEGDERFGAARLKDVLGGLVGEPAGVVPERLAAELERFQVGPQVDDTAVVAMRVTDPAGGSPRPGQAVRAIGA